ncbi:MAG TPA: MOSC domain-containing protein, partial [Pseudomonadales bacterium]|nr:MOSC domain-containing protein [Pseudomonadales bacterium]
PLGSALWQRLGARSPVPVGAFFDAFPLSVLTTATLDRLSALRPQTRFDARRFRMNVVVAARDSGFVENAWVGGTLAIGAALRVRIVMPDPRCVITTLEQDGLPRDIEVLRTLTSHNRLPFADNTEKPCAGVYGVVVSSGTIATGDAVLLH